MRLIKLNGEIIDDIKWIDVQNAETLYVHRREHLNEPVKLSELDRIEATVISQSTSHKKKSEDG